MDESTLAVYDERAQIYEATLAHTELPLELRELRRSLLPDGALTLSMVSEHESGPPFVSDDDLPGRTFHGWTAETLALVVTGAGFVVDAVNEPHPIRLEAHRTRSIADTVGPDMRLLVCGLNPSLHAADADIGFVTPGNRFWPAAIEAGLASRDRDPVHALRHHGLGMTDLVKRATPRAADLSIGEYRVGLDRVERLCSWLLPRVVCFVGLAGWRAAVDRRAAPGRQTIELGGRPVYLMPSTSGLNASSSHADFVDHFRAALRLAED